MRERTIRALAAATGLVVVSAVALFALLRVFGPGPPEEDEEPTRWALHYPRHYASFERTRIDDGRSPSGGSAPYDKLEANPFRRRAWAGHAFELEYNAARGHHYAQIDQRESRRTREREQPAGCAHCHAAEAPRLVREQGWAGFHGQSYADVAERLHFGTSCGDCHDPHTLELRITRLAFLRGMERRGVDVAQATPALMRTYVCAQCHSEYYFRGAQSELVHPWDHGLRVEEIEQHFDDYDFRDFDHAETGAPLIKIQHPEYELYSTGAHAAAGVSCPDCHMPLTRERGLRITDHWIRSPLTNLAAACGRCHETTEAALRRQVLGHQVRTNELLGLAEAALSDLMDAVVAARAAGAPDEALAEARAHHRQAQLRWDFVDAENSTGFHSPHEAARVLAHAIDLARRGERSARAAAPARRSGAGASD